MAQHNVTTYVLLGAVFILAVLAAWALPAGELVRGLVALPGVGALFAALFQLARDEARFEKDRELQRLHQTFTLGVSSHMSNVVFDKHVEFCERYMKEVDATVTTLFREGPTELALRHAGNLYGIRREHSAWLTAEMSEHLEPFESTLRKLGADTGFVRSTHGSPEYAQQRSAVVEQMYSTFAEVLDLDPKTQKSEIAKVEAVKEQVRAILGTEQLTTLRQKLLKNALTAGAST